MIEQLNYLCQCGRENLQEVFLEPKSDIIKHDLFTCICPFCQRETEVNVSYSFNEFSYLPNVDIHPCNQYYDYWKVFYSVDYGLTEIEELIKTDNKGEKQSLNRMFFTHSITLLETYFSDMLKFFILRNDAYILKFIQTSKDLKKEKFALEDFLLNDDFAKLKTKKKLDEILYHNLKVSFSIFKSVLDIAKELGVEKRAYLERLINLRHDCVHRNGITLDGVSFLIKNDELNEIVKLIKSIISFVHEHSIKLVLQTVQPRIKLKPLEPPIDFDDGIPF